MKGEVRVVVRLRISARRGALVLEYFIEGHLKDFSDLEGQFKSGRIFGRFYGDYGLPGDADSIGQGLLGHLVPIEAEPANIVFDRQVAHVRSPVDK